MKFRTVFPKRYLKLRVLATLIDYGIVLGLFVVYIYCFGANNEDGSYQVNGVMALLLPMAWFLYFVVIEAMNQATPGHDICKLIVVRADGSKITLSEAFKRRICDPIDLGMYGIPALICVCNTPKHQRLGDLLANTVVVKKTDIIEQEVTF